MKFRIENFGVGAGVGIELGCLRSGVPEQIYRVSQAVADCHWSYVNRTGWTISLVRQFGSSGGATGLSQTACVDNRGSTRSGRT